MTRQAVKPGRPGHLTGMERPISSVQAGERSENKKPALPRLDLQAEPEARALAGLRCDRRRCLQGREFAFLLRILRGTLEGSYETRGQQSYAHKLPNQTRYVSPANECWCWAAPTRKKWREPYAGRLARTVPLGGPGQQRTGAYLTRGTEKLIEYKTYL